MRVVLILFALSAVPAALRAEPNQNARFAIDYEGGPGTGIDPQWVTWTGCTDGNEYFVNNEGDPEWSGPRAGAIITWTTCQNQVIQAEGVHVVVGALSVYADSESVPRLTPETHGLDGADLIVTACNSASIELVNLPGHEDFLGRAHFGGTSEGWNPCLGTTGVPTVPTTWGRIKYQYER